MRGYLAVLTEAEPRDGKGKPTERLSTTVHPVLLPAVDAV